MALGKLWLRGEELRHELWPAVLRTWTRSLFHLHRHLASPSRSRLPILLFPPPVRPTYHRSLAPDTCTVGLMRDGLGPTTYCQHPSGPQPPIPDMPRPHTSRSNESESRDADVAKP